MSMLSGVYFCSAPPSVFVDVNVMSTPSVNIVSMRTIRVVDVNGSLANKNLRGCPSPQVMQILARRFFSGELVK